MNIKSKIATTIAGLSIAALALTGCTPTVAQQAYKDRQAQQAAITLKDSIALDNLKEKRDRENDPNKIRYVYLISFGQIIGYYIAKGNITSNSSQMAPEQEVVSAYSEGFVVDSAADDNTYGSSDPGVFFFTTDGTMIVTDVNILQSDQPINIDVPRLYDN